MYAAFTPGRVDTGRQGFGRPRWNKQLYHINSMGHEGWEISKLRVSDDPAGRVQALAIFLNGTHDLQRALEGMLWAVPTVELVSESLNYLRADSVALLFSRVFRKNYPHLVLLCADSDHLGDAEIVLEEIQNRSPQIPVIAILPTAAPDKLHRFVRRGACDFCLAPLREEDLLPRMMRWSAPPSETGGLARQLLESFGLQQFLGESRIFLEVLHQIPKLAKCDATLFITGETGTGKEMCARAVHQLGPRAAYPFIPVNCGAIPAELVENELFGHEAGSFTGAACAVQGLVSDAEGGTLFLDEVDSLPLQVQVKFLRFLQDREYRPLGARKTRKSDLRIIAASNADLDEAVRSGRFRPDLFYRLHIFPLRLPPLRERREDIPLLASHFLMKHARESSTPAKELSRAAMEKLLAYHWPGNIRELENIIARALVLSEQPVITGGDICLPGTSAAAVELSFKARKAQAIAEFETNYVRQLLAANHGNISKAARAAKKNRRAFWQLMRKHEIVPPVIA